MQNHTKRLNKCKGALWLAGVSAVMTGCTWVDLDKAAEDVLVLKPYQAKQCESMRRTTSQVLDKIWFVQRSEETMAKELATLARNTAVEVGGNAVVAETAIEQGKQTFMIFNCAHLR